MACNIHAEDVGTKLLITVTDCGTVVDISTATSLSIFIWKPDSTVLSRTGVLYTDGTDGKMYYATIAGDLDVAGSYKIQGKVGLLSGATHSTSLSTFRVECNL
jgi:hypothetical protein